MNSPHESGLIERDLIEHWQIRKTATVSGNGAVAAQHVLAAKAGADVLSAGGNAIDSAVATAFALGVVEPWMCGIGGSGYMVVWEADKKRASVIDFQGVLGNSIDSTDYPLDPGVSDSIMGFPGVVDDSNVVGYGAIAVPGAVKGLCSALERYGCKTLAEVLLPSIELAQKGLPVSWFTTLQIALAAAELGLDKTASSVYLPDGVPPQPGQFLNMGNLQSTLQTLAREGPDSVYGGSLGENMVADLQRGGSKLNLQDFIDYPVLHSESLSTEHRGVAVHTAGISSGGPRLIDTLSYIEEHLEIDRGIGPHSFFVYARALEHAWKKHNVKIGRTTEKGSCTSHLSTVDKNGNMVALTYTLLNRFGSGVVLPGTGVLMNNSVSYFDPRPGTPVCMAPGKRINASNMCPVIATASGEALFAIGASGANYIMPCVAQIAALMLDFGLSLEEAIHHPRLDVADRDSIRADPRLGDAVISELGKHYSLEVAQLLVYPKLYAGPSGVSRDPLTGELHAINDPSQPIGGGVVA